MESSIAPFFHRRTHLPSRTNHSFLHHLCTGFDREPRFSLATPAGLQELVLRTEIAQVSPGEACEKPENLSVVESRSNGVSADSSGEKVETFLQESSLMLGDFFDGLDLQDAPIGSESQDFVPESCVNLFESLDVNDYDNGVIMVASLDVTVKQQAAHVLDVVEKSSDIATEMQVDLVRGDRKEEEVPKSSRSHTHIFLLFSALLLLCDPVMYERR